MAGYIGKSQGVLLTNVDSNTVETVDIQNSAVTPAKIDSTGSYTIAALDVNGTVTSDGASLDGAVVINESGADVDFRVESDTNTHALFVDGASSEVGINTSTPSGPLHVFGYNNGEFLVDTWGTITQKWNSNPVSVHNWTGSGDALFRQYNTSDGGVVSNQITAASGSVFNESGRDMDFRVESNNNPYALFVDGGNDRVVITDSSSEPTLVTGGLLNIFPTSGVTYTSSSGHGDQFRIQVSNDSGTAAQLATMQLIVSSNGGTNNALGNINVFAPAANSHNTIMTTQIRKANGTVIEPLRMADGESIFNEHSVDQDFRVESNDNTHMIFVDGGQNRVNIGNSSGNGMLSVRNTTGTDIGGDTTFYVETNANDWCSIFNYTDTSSSNHYYLKFQLAGSTKGTILGSSSGVTYNTTSDRRLKDNIETITDGTDKLMAMNPVTHTWITDPDAPAVHGFIAQEMQDVVPEAVSGEDGGDEMMSMDYGRITPVIVAALQDAHREIQNLKAEIAALKGDK